MHIKQHQLAKFLDLNLSAATQPSFLLHEASVGVSFGQTLPESSVVSRIADEGFPEDEFGGLKLEVGVVNMPPQYYFADAGGMRLRWNIDVNLGGWEGDSYRLFFMSVGMNRADTLTVFPYASNFGYMEISGSFL